MNNQTNMDYFDTLNYNHTIIDSNLFVVVVLFGMILELFVPFVDNNTIWVVILKVFDPVAILDIAVLLKLVNLYFVN